MSLNAAAERCAEVGAAAPAVAGAAATITSPTTSTARRDPGRHEHCEESADRMIRHSQKPGLLSTHSARCGSRRSLVVVPELPEVEITARRLDAALAGAQIESVLAPGLNALKTFDPPLSALEGRRIETVGRRGKQLVITVSDGLVVLVHLMSAGRLQLFDKRAGPRDRTSRLLIRVRTPSGSCACASSAPSRPLGSRSCAPTRSRMTSCSRRSGPRPGRSRRRTCASCSTRRARCTPCCAISASSPASGDRGWTRSCGPRGCRRSSAATTSPRRRPRPCARRSSTTLDGALDHYERVVRLPIPDKLPLPLQVHRKAGEPCPRCGATIEAVYYEDYVMCYCPAEQTAGKVLKDRRLSRLLK